MDDADALSDWRAIESSSGPNDFRRHIGAFPETDTAVLARASSAPPDRLVSCRRRQVSPSTPTRKKMNARPDDSTRRQATTNSGVHGHVNRPLDNSHTKKVATDMLKKKQNK